MSAPVARMEWRLALRRRRLFALNAGIPLLLVLPLALGAAPPFHAAAVYAVLFVLFGTMGSAIPLLRDGEDGLLKRVLLTGYPPARFLGERLAAGAAVDLLQLSPALALILLTGGASAGQWLWAFLLLALALVGANLVGMWVAALARSLAEGALFGSVVTLFLLHGSGVFRTAPEGTVGAVLERALPFGPLHQILLQVSLPAPAHLPPLTEMGLAAAAPVLLTAAALGLTLLLATHLFRLTAH